MVTSAFTLTPENFDILDSTSFSCECCTCTPEGNCREASFCGMTNCPNPMSCDLSGVLCGPECNESIEDLNS